MSLWSYLKPKCRGPLIQIEKANCLSHRKGKMSWYNSNVGAKAGSKTSPLRSSIEIQIIDEQLDKSIASVWKLNQGNLPGPKWALDYFKFKFNHLLWLAGTHVSLPFWDMSPFLRALCCWSGLGFRSSFLHTFFLLFSCYIWRRQRRQKMLDIAPSGFVFLATARPLSPQSHGVS